MSEEMLALEEELRQAMVESDVDKLDELLSPDLVFTTFLGELITKAEDLEAHGSGLLNMHAVELSEQKFLPVGDTVVATCLAEIDASFDDDRTKKSFRFTRVWAPGESGKRQVIAGQATLVYASLMDD